MKIATALTKYYRIKIQSTILKMPVANTTKNHICRFMLAN